MNTESADPDLTPMLDVVFIMLIFFIVTATFVNETGIDLPAGDKKSQAVSAIENVVIEISPGDQYLIFGKSVDFRMLKNRLAAYYAENPERPFVVRLHGESRANNLVHVLDVGRTLGINIKLADGA